MRYGSLAVGFALLSNIGALPTAAPPLHHPIATSSLAAQAAFDRGLALVYAFNFRAAQDSFQQASRLDPKAPMPYWGIALALGPNLNDRQPAPFAERKATDALTRAMELAGQLADTSEAKEERQYIAALSLRLSCDPLAPSARLEAAYGSAMRQLSAGYPSDPDAATLYAESLMEQRQWERWVSGGAPASSAKILTTLQDILRRWPNHLGANHYYIHAAEGAGQPSLALASAERLGSLGAALAGDGHLLHMPAHVFLHSGRFADAERASLEAAAADRAYLRDHPDDSKYAATYQPHNLSFLVYAASMDGDFPTARDAARELASEARQSGDPSFLPSSYATAPFDVLVRFARWKEILALPAPGLNDGEASAVWWHYARASALAGSGSLPAALREASALRAAERPRASALRTAAIPKTGSTNLMDALLAARIAGARGNWSFAVDQLRQAVAQEEQLPDSDPPRWFPLRAALGAALLRAHRAPEAIQVLQQGLARASGDPRSYFVLSLAYAQLGRTQDALAASTSYRRLWKGSALSLEDF